MNKEGVKKICFVASSGGHLEEISRLKGIEKAYDCFLVTEKSDFEIKNFCDKRYIVPMMNRRQLNFLPKFIWLFYRTLRILLKERPDFRVEFYSKLRRRCICSGVFILSDVNHYLFILQNVS